jgi:hypothetical protein
MNPNYLGISNAPARAHTRPRSHRCGRQELRWHRRTCGTACRSSPPRTTRKRASDECRSCSRAVRCCGSCMLTRAATRAFRGDDRGAARKTRVTGGCFRLRLPRNDWIYQSAIRLEISRSIFFASPWAIAGVLNREGIANHTGPKSCVAGESPVQGIAHRFDVVLGIISPIAHYPNKTS